MRRRDFIKVIAGSAAAWPLAARAQKTTATTRIGYFGPNRDKNPVARVGFDAFRAELGELGLKGGLTFSADYHDLDDPRGLSVVVAELMQSRPDIILTTGPAIALQAIVAAKSGIPIVMIAINFDPVRRGYINSLARPGGDITGVVFQQLELAQKQVEIVTQAFPGRARLVALFDAQSADQFEAAERAAKALNVRMQPLKLENPPYDFEAAFRNASAASADVVLVLSSPFFGEQDSRIAALAIAHRLPTMFIFRTYVDAGGLMSYGVDFPDMFRRAADDIVKIGKGAKPADIPVEQADKFEFVVNLKTAKAIGVELPTVILLRANQVIE